MIDERLLLASALVHARPGGQLVAVDAAGRRIAVGRHPSADVDPCRWRAMVAGAVAGRTAHALAGFVLDTVGGSLDAAETGGFVDRNDVSRRWFAVALPPCVVADTLRSVDLPGLPEEAVTATIRPDPDLGITVVAVGVDAPCMIGGLEVLAADVAGALAVAELCATLPIIER